MKSIGWGLVIISVVVGIFFGDVIVKNKVLLPGDIIVGMYYPWLSEKWGYTVGVPVKNPIVSDVVSAIYIWKKLTADAYRRGSIPLWNPYSYSGYPLLANLQSGALYPLNLLMVWGGDTLGWNLMLIFGVWGGAAAMYLFLRNKGMGMWGAAAGSLSYALSLYAITWMEFMTTAQMMVWFPLILLSADRAIKGKTEWKLMLPASIYMMITAGRFEILVYMLMTLILYAVYLGYTEKKWRWLVQFGLLTGIGLALGAGQIWPTVEMGLRSVRFSEVYIAEQRWGLMPITKIITGLVPDFFGNPATGNYWGWWQYHETVLYTGIAAVLAIFGAIWKYKELGKYKFWLILILGALVLGTDNPVSVGIMQLKIPVMSTVSAGRIFVLFTFGAAVLTGWFIDNIRKFSRKELLEVCLIPGFLILAAVLIVVIAPVINQNHMVALKNSAVPLTILGVIGICLIFRSKRFFGILMILIICTDLFRAGWKFLPAVDKSLVFPAEKVMSFLTEKSQTEIFRVDREHGEIMPPSTWTMYGLMSPSGYDPLAPKEYTANYSRDLNGTEPVFSRYAELTRYDATELGKYNVKYLLVLKRDATDKIGGNILNEKINLPDWNIAMETGEVVVLENSKYQPRVRLEGTGKINISSYLPGRIDLEYFQSRPGTEIAVADAYYPGWKACEQKICMDAERAGGFMKIKTRNDQGKITLIYRPDSFRNGLTVSGLALLTWGAIIFFGRGRLKREGIQSGPGFPSGKLYQH